MVLREIGKEFPENWKPENAGDCIEGIYAKKKIDVGPKNSLMYYIDVDGVIKTIWGCKVLDDKMDDLELSIGDKIKITYEGMDEKKKYHKYKVEKDFPDEETPEAELVE